MHHFPRPIVVVQYGICHYHITSIIFLYPSLSFRTPEENDESRFHCILSRNYKRFPKQRVRIWNQGEVKYGTVHGVDTDSDNNHNFLLWNIIHKSMFLLTIWMINKEIHNNFRAENATLWKQMNILFVYGDITVIHIAYVIIIF
jgi:hypothetical protein